MFKTTLITKGVGNPGELPAFDCLICHAKANVNDYFTVFSAVNSNGVGSKIELLLDCKFCFKYNKAKGHLTSEEFYKKLNSDILL